jgi:hypothetical protein
MLFVKLEFTIKYYSYLSLNAYAYAKYNLQM